MITDIIINYATILAYIAFTVDAIIQIVHIYKRKSSLDISLKGSFIRLTAGLIVLSKFLLVNDLFLIIGHGIYVISYFIYVIMLVLYRRG